jgi:predicted nuclease of predicted toxin-antitoxin system
LQGSPDQSIYDHCCREQRCLVTLDVDFADVTRFPPNQTAGIAVIRVPKNPSLPLLESLIRQFLYALNTASVNKQLWIVEVGRIRVHQSEIDEDAGMD